MKAITATQMPWTKERAVCFTECVWSSLPAHADHYSAFGLGFSKAFVFSQGGGPAFYVRQDLYERQLARDRGWAPEVWPFATPFVPEYATEEHRRDHWGGKPPLDYSDEREWRTPSDLLFEFTDVAFVIVETAADAVLAAAPASLEPRNIIVMDTDRRIREIWPPS